MIDEKRLVEEFMELCAIPSPSGKEGKVAKVLRQKLVDMGFDVWEDAAGQRIGGETGNLIGRLPALAEGIPILLSAHMDTVGQAEEIVPVLRDGAVYSQGETILGGDDKAGIAAILEGIRVIQEAGFPHGPIEIAFTIWEEGGLRGAKHLDCSALEARMAFVFDSSEPPGHLIVRGPAQNHIHAFITGRAAHAGICPEEGISAIKVAAKAISKMKLGRLDGETTANIGTINGGSATNIVPEKVVIKGEARSHDPEKLKAQTEHMVRAYEEAAGEMGAQVEVQVESVYPRIALTEEDPVVRLAVEAVRRAGTEAVLASTGGGSDANVMNGAGLPTLNLGIGMSKVHTPDEFITVADLKKTALIVVELIRGASGAFRG